MVGWMIIVLNRLVVVCLLLWIVVECLLFVMGLFCLVIGCLVVVFLNILVDEMKIVWVGMWGRVFLRCVNVVW